MPSLLSHDSQSMVMENGVQRFGEAVLQAVDQRGEMQEGKQQDEAKIAFVLVFHEVASWPNMFVGLSES